MLFRLAVLASWLTLAAGYRLGSWITFLLELNASFPHLHFIAAIISLSFFVRRRLFFWILGSFGALVIQTTNIFWPIYSSANPNFTKGTELTVLYSNVYVHNQSSEKLRALIMEHQPTVVLLTEVSQEWLDHLNISESYPYSYLKPGKSADGNAIYSMLPLGELRRVPDGGYFASLFAKLELAGTGPIYLKLVHAPTPPSDPTGDIRLEFFTELARESSNDDKSRTILFGDFNTASSNRLLTEILEKLNLRLASNGWFDFPTWRPVGFPFLLAPIDHLAVGANVQTLSYGAGPDIGSDHLPLLARLRIR